MIVVQMSCKSHIFNSLEKRRITGEFTAKVTKVIKVMHMTNKNLFSNIQKNAVRLDRWTAFSER